VLKHFSGTPNTAFGGFTVSPDSRKGAKMQKQKFSRSRMLISGALVAGVMAIGGFAFTNSNTVPDTKAGDGAGTITGYVASSVHYGLNSTDPSKIDSVTFTVDSAPVTGSTIKAQLVTSGTWYVCTNSTTTVTCNTTVGTQATVTPANNLRVVIAD